jgi:hypothetical protein
MIPGLNCGFKFTLKDNELVTDDHVSLVRKPHQELPREAHDPREKIHENPDVHARNNNLSFVHGSTRIDVENTRSIVEAWAA